MSPEETIESFVRRLAALHDDPPLRFVRTSRVRAAEYLCASREIRGETLLAIEETERRLGVTFPDVYREFLRRMGAARGGLFRGSDVVALDAIEASRAEARDLMSASPEATLPADAIPMLSHQGYQVMFFVPRPTTDVPIFVLREGDSEAREVAPSLAALLDAEISAMEDDDARARAAGGYFVQVMEGGGVALEHPARASGIRALDRSHDYTD
ncbi:MAG: SMI1/KNR4 family protein [Deltaproteobacteria bacterium]|nr:SMI1/KNR4 family protein [Deltaproteobacteria bacterium]